MLGGHAKKPASPAANGGRGTADRGGAKRRRGLTHAIAVLRRGTDGSRGESQGSGTRAVAGAAFWRRSGLQQGHPDTPKGSDAKWPSNRSFPLTHCSRENPSFSHFGSMNGLWRVATARLPASCMPSEFRQAPCNHVACLGYHVPSLYRRKSTFIATPEKARRDVPCLSQLPIFNSHGPFGCCPACLSACCLPSTRPV